MADYAAPIRLHTARRSRNDHAWRLLPGKARLFFRPDQSLRVRGWSVTSWKEKRRKRYAEDPEYRNARLASNRAHYERHKQEINERRRLKWAASDRKWLLQAYGMSPQDYDMLSVRQGGACAICRRQPAEGLCVDHCHATGKVRGLLCRTCNSAIGFLRDDETLVAAALAYLRQASAS
jgi:hypothetical protein